MLEIRTSINKLGFVGTIYTRVCKEEVYTNVLHMMYHRPITCAVLLV